MRFKAVAKRVLGSSLTVVAVVGLVYGVCVARQSLQYGRNLSGFVLMGDRYMSPEAAPAGFIVLPNSPGYDGEFFYMAAHDPLMVGDGFRRMDVPAYRYQRMLYPVAVWVAAAGQSRFFPHAMLGVNLIAVLAGTWMVSRMARARGLNVWTGCFYAGLSGLMIALFRDLAGPLAVMWVVAAVYAFDRDRPWLCAGAMAAAVLTREMLVVVLPVFWFVTTVLQRRVRRGTIMLTPLIPLALWQLYVALRAGEAAWRGGARSFGPPLKGLLSHLRHVLPAADRVPAEKAYLVLFVAACVLSLVLAIVELCRRRDEVSLCFLGFALQPFVMTRYVWVEPWSYGRVLLPTGVFLVLSYVRSKRAWHMVPLGLNVACLFVFLDWNRLIWLGESLIARAVGHTG